MNDARPGIAHDPFREIAAGYEGWYRTPLGSFVAAEEASALFEALPETGGHLLEVGAGTGWWSRILARRGFRVSALEPSPAMRGVGVEDPDSQGITWVEGFGEELPFADAAFDVVLFATVIEFVPDPRQVLAEAWRVVRPNGALVVAHLGTLSPWAALYRRLGERSVAPWTHARFVDSDDLEGWLGRAPDGCWSSVFLAPGAQPPFETANDAGRVAGNDPAFNVVRWRRSR